MTLYEIVRRDNDRQKVFILKILGSKWLEVVRFYTISGKWFDVHIFLRKINVRYVIGVGSEYIRWYSLPCRMLYQNPKFKVNIK